MLRLLPVLCPQVGADEKLGSVIDGESLVNDGSALVVFLVLQRFVQGESLTAGQVGCAEEGEFHRLQWWGRVCLVGAM
jgi:NhaP-type Na+/H+ or K+/H+ antiporter